jgi:hypothetical protein
VGSRPKRVEPSGQLAEHCVETLRGNGETCPDQTAQATQTDYGVLQTVEQAPSGARLYQPGGHKRPTTQHELRIRYSVTLLSTGTAVCGLRMAMPLNRARVVWQLTRECQPATPVLLEIPCVSARDRLLHAPRRSHDIPYDVSKLESDQAVPGAPAPPRLAPPRLRLAPPRLRYSCGSVYSTGLHSSGLRSECARPYPLVTDPPYAIFPASFRADR